MPRVRVEAPGPTPAELPRARSEAADALDAFAPPRAKRKASKSMANLEREVERVAERLRDDDWSDLRPGDLVAAHAFCHHGLYGAHDGDLVGQGWGRACIAAGSLIKREFGDDLGAAMKYVRWAWQRERRREERRKRNGADGEGRRLTWRNLLASRFVLTDYRVESRRADG